MSPTDFRREQHAALTPIVENLLDFLWGRWGQLGVATHTRGLPQQYLLDPEALLLFTLTLGRFDPRLFDETLDWCAVNGDWISGQRLKTLLGRYPADDMLHRTMRAVAATLAKQSRPSRWRLFVPSLSSRRAETLSPFWNESEPLAFFRDEAGGDLPLIGERDASFAEVGLLRSPVVLRGLSLPPPVRNPVCLLLRLRALFGMDPRAEAIAYLLTHPGVAGTREIARATGYAPSTVHTMLTRLSAGEFVQGYKGGYELEASRWHSFLNESAIPAWVNWADVLHEMANTVETLVEIQSLSPYLQSSRCLRVGERLGVALLGSGLPNAFAGTWELSGATERLLEGLLRLAKHLAEGS